MATKHSQLRLRLAEAEAAERKLDALAQLQQRLADFDVVLSRGALPGRPVCAASALTFSHRLEHCAKEMLPGGVLKSRC